jgi:hypothetical protein
MNTAVFYAVKTSCIPGNFIFSDKTVAAAAKNTIQKQRELRRFAMSDSFIDTMPLRLK